MKRTVSVSCSECLPLVTTITFINIMVFVIELCLCLPNSHTLFLLISHFRSLNKTKDFYIVFPSDSSSKLFNKCLSISILSSFPTLYPITLSQSAVNTQSPHHNLLSTHNRPITICCQHTITLSQSAVNTQSPYHNMLSTHNRPITICCQHTITLSQSAINTQSPYHNLLSTLSPP